MSHFNHIPNKIRQDLVLLNLLTIVPNLLLHDTLLMLQSESL